MYNSDAYLKTTKFTDNLGADKGILLFNELFPSYFINNSQKIYLSRMVKKKKETSIFIIP